MRPPVRLCEFQRVRIVENDDDLAKSAQAVTKAEADVIQRSAARFGCSRPREWFSIVRSEGVSYLKAGCWVGVIGVGQLRLEVLPKIGTEDEGLADPNGGLIVGDQVDVLEMLVVTGKLPSGLKSVVGGQSMDRMLEAILRWYMQDLNSAMNLGLLRGYRERREDLASMKGRVDPARQWMNKCLRKPLVACVYDDFTPDTRLNQILKAGLRAALALARDPGLRYSIKSTLSALEEVADVSISGAEASAYKLGRREQRYTALVSVAGFLLEGETPDPFNALRESDLKIPRTVGMLINMEKLFEEYVYVMFKSGGGHFGERYVIPKHDISAQEHDRRAHCLIRNRNPEEALFGLKPDLLFRDAPGGKVVLVGDTKWKRISPPSFDARVASSEEVVKVGKFGVSQSDVYQLFAYSEYFGESNGPSDVVLIYPQNPRVEQVEVDVSSPRTNDITLSALPSVGTIDWEFSPKSREGRKSAKLIIKLFRLPLLANA